MQYFNQLIFNTPLWLVAIPVAAVILIYLCRKNDLVTKKSVWSFLYKSSINPETIDASSKKINKKIYLLCLISLSCLFLVLSLPTLQKKGFIYIVDEQIAEILNKQQRLDFLSRLEDNLKKLNLEHSTIYINKKKAPNFSEYLETHTKFSISSNSLHEMDSQNHQIIICGMSYPINKKASFIPLYNKSDSWSITKCIHLHGNTYELSVFRDDDFSTELKISVNGTELTLNEPLQKRENILNITIKDERTKIELIPNDNFNANNQITIMSYKDQAFISDITLNNKVKMYIKNNIHFPNNIPGLLITNNFNKWHKYNGPAWLFDADQNSHLKIAKINELNEHHLRFNALVNKDLSHSILNWEIKLLPKYYFTDKSNTLFSLGNDSVVKLFPYNNKISTTLSLAAFPDSAKQIDFFQTLIHASSKNISRIKHSVEFPSNLKKRIIKADHQPLPLKLIINCLLLISILIFSLAIFFDQRSAKNNY